MDAIEIHTGKYCDSIKNDEINEELDKIKVSATYAKSLGLDVHAGHGLNYNNVVEIAKIIEITELNIGHFVIGEAIFTGIEMAIKTMRKIINDARENSLS